VSHNSRTVWFGRIVDVFRQTIHGPACGVHRRRGACWSLGRRSRLFTICAVPAVALHADRLGATPSARLDADELFEHIMQLRLTFHAGTHSAADKVMWTAPIAVGSVFFSRFFWLGFFRAAFRRNPVAGGLCAGALHQWRTWRSCSFVLCVVSRCSTLCGAQAYGMQSRRGALQRSLRACHHDDARKHSRLVKSLVRIRCRGVQLGCDLVADKLLRCRSGAVVVGAPGTVHHLGRRPPSPCWRSSPFGIALQ